jgi:SOS-response transcriptional repressor LexA
MASKTNYTAKQRDILRYIKEYIETYDRPPTNSEIGAAMKITAQTAHGHLMRLTKRGAISSRTHEARSITIRDPDFKPETSNESKIRRMAHRDPAFRQFILDLAAELTSNGSQ